MISGLNSLSFEELLMALDPDSFELRRMRGDLIEICRMLKGLDRVDADRLFPLVGEGWLFRTKMEEFL